MLNHIWNNANADSWKDISNVIYNVIIIYNMKYIIIYIKFGGHITRLTIQTQINSKSK